MAGWRPRKRQKQTARIIAGLERREQALELRKKGKSYRLIGQALGITTKGAHKTVKRAIDDLNQRIGEDAAAVKRLELLRLDWMFECLEKKIQKGEPQAVTAAIRIAERRAKLLGIDAVEKKEITVSGGFTLEQLEKVAELEAATKLNEPLPPEGTAPAPTSPVT